MMAAPVSARSKRRPSYSQADGHGRSLSLKVAWPPATHLGRAKDEISSTSAQRTMARPGRSRFKSTMNNTQWLSEAAVVSVSFNHRKMKLTVYGSTDAAVSGSYFSQLLTTVDGRGRPIRQWNMTFARGRNWNRN